MNTPDTHPAASPLASLAPAELRAMQALLELAGKLKVYTDAAVDLVRTGERIQRDLAPEAAAQMQPGLDSVRQILAALGQSPN